MTRPDSGHMIAINLDGHTTAQAPAAHLTFAAKRHGNVLSADIVIHALPSPLAANIASVSWVVIFR